jgi:glycosyltransferase involved in cell wall biosynthesis
MTLSIVTQLLDWNFGFKQALPTWIKYPCDEIVILDWGTGKESALEVAGAFLHDSRVVFVRNITDIPYNKSIARNKAVEIAQGDVIFYVDSDVQLLKPAPVLGENHYRRGQPLGPGDKSPFFTAGGVKFNRSLDGTAMFHRRHFDLLNGFDERMQGWGWQDSDFYRRLSASGLEAAHFPAATLKHVDHADGLRTKNFPLKSLELSVKINENLGRNPWGPAFTRKKLELRKYHLVTTGMTL